MQVCHLDPVEFLCMYPLAMYYETAMKLGTRFWNWNNKNYCYYFYPSPISLMVSVDNKHHVYLLFVIIGG